MVACEHGHLSRMPLATGSDESRLYLHATSGGGGGGGYDLHFESAGDKFGISKSCKSYLILERSNH